MSVKYIQNVNWCHNIMLYNKFVFLTFYVHVIFCSDTITRVFASFISNRCRCEFPVSKSFPKYRKKNSHIGAENSHPYWSFIFLIKIRRNMLTLVNVIVFILTYALMHFYDVIRFLWRNLLYCNYNVI